MRAILISFLATAMVLSAQSGAESKREGGQKGNVLDVAYALQTLGEDGKTQTVREDSSLRSGDRLALLVKTSAPVYLYVFNRGRGEGSYHRLFPAASQSANVAGSFETPRRIPEDRDAWMRLDKKAGNENMVMIVSRLKIDRLEGGMTIGRDEFEDTLAEVERSQRPSDMQHWNEGAWSRFAVSQNQPGVVVVSRIPLLHK